MKKTRWVALSAATLCVVPALAQQTRPDAGTLLEQERERQIQQLPAPGGAPTVTVPATPAVAPINPDIKVTPAGFRVAGNTLFTEAELMPVLAEYVGKPTDMEGLVKAAAAVRRYYRERGYLLTEAYLPVQQFSATGAVVTIQVLEARVGKVKVVAEDAGVSESLATKIVNANLATGDHISEYSLDKPILLLRDLIGFDATAAVEPGTNTGEADITVSVKSAGPKVDGLVGVDNFGARSAGAIRAYANANWNNPTGNGDQLSARVQATDRSDTNLYRLGYTIAVGGWATKLGVSFTKTQYALGKQFAALGASGDAEIYALTATQPFIRSRSKNVLGSVTYEHKNLNDRTTTPPTAASREIDLVRFSVLGNFVDNVLGSSFNSYAVNATVGELKLDPATLAIDQGAAGLRTAGSFSKLNIEYLRTTFTSPAGRVIASLQGQYGSKNLASAEKFGLGGPQGVRGYPVGEGVGDTGLIFNLEYRHQLPDWFDTKIPMAASVFYDWGWVRFNQDRSAPAAVAAQASETLSSVGFGLTVGNYGSYLLTTQLAWRLDRRPATDPDKKPRVWVSLQKWL